jgi:EAL domain-containing protein (putative c-di-GMP-specific phosphodiesterase class I)
MAEETGAITQIGNWAFMEAAHFCKACTERTGRKFQVSINKSPVQFMSRNSDQNWLKYLFEQGISPDCISIEITEGVLLDASEVVVEKLQKYRQAGMQFALDDFGTGYASLSYLQKFQIDYVKIDQSFVRDMTSSDSSRTIAETIIVMAHKLGKKVIAEGVETKDQMACLAAADCDYAQGYLFSPAVPGEQLMQLLSAVQPQIQARAMH